MADRIVVMDAGRIAQVGTPKEVYDRPNSPFVASFMGADNTLDLEVSAGCRQGRRDQRRRRQHGRLLSGDAPVGPVTAYFRDDVAKLDAPDARRSDGSIVLPGRIAQRAYPGGHYRYAVAIGDRHFTVTDDRYHDVDRAGRACACRWRRCTCSPSAKTREETMRRRLLAAGLAAPSLHDQRGSAADAQRRDRRRPEHGRLRQGLSRPEVREDASRA